MHKSVHAHTHAVISWPTLFFCSSASQVTWLMQIPMYQWYINKQNILINIIIQSIVKHTHMSVHAHTYVVICWPTFCFSVPQLCRGPGGCVQGRICPTQWKLPARLQVVSLLNLFLSFLCTCKDDSLQSNSWFYFKLTMSAGYGFGGGGGGGGVISFETSLGDNIYWGHAVDRDLDPASNIGVESVQRGQEGQLLTFCSLHDTGIVIFVDTFPLLLTNKHLDMFCRMFFWTKYSTLSNRKTKQDKL